MSESIDYKIPTTDKLELATTVITPDNAPLGVIQFHAGTVIRKEFYLKFAHFLADEGFIVVLFDYRGVGGSRPKSLRGFDASIEDWGKKDAKSILNWIKESYPDLPIHLFAHSMGGQILGMMSNWSEFDKIIVVASSSGNWNNFTSSYKRKIKISSNLLFPIHLRFFGYIPGRFGLGQDWPKGVAVDWWKNSRQNGLMSDYMEKKTGQTNFGEIDKSINAYFFKDDHMTTPNTIPNYQRCYPNAKVTTHLITPEDYGFKEIGHFGLFKERTKGRLWSDIISTFKTN